jgi:primosomal protein N'
VPRFLTGELERRRELGYPPFRHLVRILVSGARAGTRDPRVGGGPRRNAGR